MGKMADSIIVDGYVIVPPATQWNQSDESTIWHSCSPQSFGSTPAEAWRRLIHRDHYPHKYDFGSVVQRWHDRGYRVKKATLEIFEEWE